MASFPDAVVAHDKRMRALELLAVRAGRKFWRGVSTDNLTGSWNSELPKLAVVVAAIQTEAAIEGASYGAAALASQGIYKPPQGFVDVRAFAGVGSDGGSLDALLYSPVAGVKQLIGAGSSLSQALSGGRSLLDRNVQSAVADAGRGAASVDIASRRGVGYVRMLSTPSCPRCVVLAGKFYRWNTGFLRHPRCDCRHIPTAENISGDATTDPYEYFKSLDAVAQDKQFTKAGAQAIRDGGDIFQVVNSRRGMKYAGESADGSKRGQAVKGAFTTEATTRRGSFGKSRRLTPEAIYKLNGDNREAALKDLTKYGYILPGGQNPLGSIVGQREGFGALGGGGARKAASQAVLDARASGVRDGSRYTMTEAERRLYDAQMRWSMVQQGRNPYSSPGFGNKPDPFGVGVNKSGAGNAPLTPEIAAQVEKDYRRWLATGGQIFN